MPLPSVRETGFREGSPVTSDSDTHGSCGGVNSADVGYFWTGSLTKTKSAFKAYGSVGVGPASRGCVWTTKRSRKKRPNKERFAEECTGW
eukprot:2093404-Pyramimonas_sp.AAC.1